MSLRARVSLQHEDNLRRVESLSLMSCGKRVSLNDSVEEGKLQNS